MADPIDKTLIFVLDDEAEAGTMIRDILRRNMDATVKAFVRLDDMIADDDLVHVDLFVLDIQLEDKVDGFDVPACLPTRCRFAAFLFVSGYPLDRGQYDRASHLAFFDFIGKPFSMIHFVHRVNLLLAARLKMPNDVGDRILDLWSVAPFVAMVLDVDFKVRLVNQQLAALLEAASPREIVGRSWSDFLPADDVAAVRDIHATVLNGDLSRSGEVTNKVLSSTGATHRIKWFNSPFEGFDGEALTLSIGVPGEYKVRMADRLRRAWKESILKHRAAIQAIKRLPLNVDVPEVCEINGGDQ